MTVIADWPLLLRVHAALSRFPRPATRSELFYYGTPHLNNRRMADVQQALDELVRLGWATAEDRTERFRYGAVRIKTWTYYRTMKGKSVTYPCPKLPRSLRTAGTFAMWTIYSSLPAWPRTYTVLHWPAGRVRDGADRVPDPTPLYQGPNLHDAHCALPDGADTCLHRCHDDDPSIVETWI